MSKHKKSEVEHWAWEYGKDSEILDWLSFQPSCVDGSWNQWDSESGCGRNIACHVRRISRGAGTGTKPPFSAIPMTQDQHLRENDYPLEWRIKQADKYLDEWVKWQTEDCL